MIICGLMENIEFILQLFNYFMYIIDIGEI